MKELLQVASMMKRMRVLGQSGVGIAGDSEGEAP